MSRICLLSVLLLALLAGAAPCMAQAVHRCIAADGNAYYTDRDCGDVAAAERPVTVNPHAAAEVLRGPGCARTPEELVIGVRKALESRDGNRLAAFYDWKGMDGDTAYHVLDRLSLLSRDPLLNLRLDSGNDATTPEQTTRPPRQLLIEHAPATGSGSSQITSFALVIHAGCWWLRY